MRRYWKAPELRLLRELYPNTSNDELAARFGRKRKQIAMLACKLGIRKSPEFMAKHCRFRPGHATWNKGKRWDNPASHATRFQKGQRCARHRPVGSERLERDGVFVKVAEPDVWVRKPRAVWEKTFGPIPAGMLVRVRDGDEQNCAPENLMLVTRTENARLNGANRKPRERRKRPTWMSPLQGVAA